MAERLENDLKKLGLSDNEASVYLSALELGPSPVQNISRHAAVPRATTYLVLRALAEKGLVTTFEQQKKLMFAAESPDHLTGLLEAQRSVLRERENIFKSLVPALAARGQFPGTKRPVIRYYDGPQAHRTLIRENLRPGVKEILSMFCTDDADAQLARSRITPRDLAQRRKRLGIARRAIYTWRKTPPAPGRVQKTARYIQYTKLPLTADIVISGERVSFVPYDMPIRAIAVEDKAIATAMRAVFDQLWGTARPRGKS